MATGRVVLQNTYRTSLAVAGRIRASLQDLVGQHEMAIDPGAAETQPCRCRHGAPSVLSTDQGGPPEVTVVRAGDGLLGFVESSNRHDWTNQFRLNYFVVLECACHDGWFETVPGPPAAVPPVTISKCAAMEARSIRVATRFS